MSKQNRRPTKSSPTANKWLIVALAGVIVLIGGLIAAPAISRNAGSGGAQTNLPNSKNTFSVPTLVGQAALSFTATNVDGKPFTVTPGDGRAKVLVFYMGYG